MYFEKKNEKVRPKSVQCRLRYYYDSHNAAWQHISLDTVHSSFSASIRSAYMLFINLWSHADTDVTPMTSL